MIMGKRSINTKTEKDVLPLPLPALVQNISSGVPINDIYNILTKYECISIEKTKNQSVNPVWHEQRRGRLTASNFYKICTRTNTLQKKTDQNPQVLVSEIMGGGKQYMTYAMKHGIAMEPHAKQKLIEVLKQTHKQISSQDTGLFVSEEYSHLGASPDLIINCQCCGSFVVEIKCPISTRDTIPSVHNLPYLEVISEKTTLKENHPYYYQIQGQMALTKIKQGIFFVYSHHGYFMQEINFENELWNKMLMLKIELFLG